MNHPFPTALDLASETAIEKLLAEQAAETAIFGTIIRQAHATISALHFPLGSPAIGYDLVDIEDTLDRWTNGRDPQQLAEAAEDAVLEMMAPPREEYPDHGPTDPWNISGPRP